MEIDMTEAVDKQTADAIAEAIRDDLLDMGYGDILDFQWQLVVSFTDEDDDATDVVSRSNRPENLGDCGRHCRRR